MENQDQLKLYSLSEAATAMGIGRDALRSLFVRRQNWLYPGGQFQKNSSSGVDSFSIRKHHKGNRTSANQINFKPRFTKNVQT